MKIKQTPQELEKIQAEVAKSLEPAVFAWNLNANIQMLAGYAGTHFTTNDGLTDLSFANVRKAILALKDSLVWTVPPQSQSRPVYGAEQRGLKNHAQPREEYKPDPSKDVRALAKKAALTEASESILGDCVRAIQDYRGKTHAGSEKGRAVLRGILDKGTAGGAVTPTPAEALHILDKIRERSRTLYDEPSY